MSIKSRIKYIPVVLKYPLSLTQKKKYVFIISHMRSYSTLLSHILGSHKDINGYSELHYSYLNKFDSIKAKIQVMYTLGGRLDGVYILDKLLHNANQISESFIINNTVKLIFLVRKPIDTYKSQINLGLKITKSNQHIDPIQVNKYYINRLKMIVGEAKSLNTEKILIKSESIINDPKTTLEKLKEFLDLDNSLTSNYQQFKFSGSRQYGDSLDNIKRSTISRNSNKYGNITIPDKILGEANILYKNSIGKIIRYCDK